MSPRSGASHGSRVGPLARWGPVTGGGTALFSSAFRAGPLSRTPCKTAGPVTPGGGPGRASASPGSALEVDQVLQDLVGAGDHAAVRLEAALGHDEAGELLAEVDVRHLQGTGVEDAAPTGAGHVDHRHPGVGAPPEGGATGLLQTTRVVERGEGELPQRLPQAVGVDAGDRAVVAQGERLQRAQRETVLLGS